MSEPSHIEQLTGLVCRVWPPNQREAAGLALQLHGLGGDEDSMSVFRPTLPAHMRVISPRAPFLLTPGGNSWHPELANHGWPTIKDFDQSTARIEALLQLCRNEDPHAGPVLIVGFSQGAAAAVAFAAQHPALIAGLALLAGFVPSSDSLIAERPLSGLPTFLAYGTRDATIPPAKSREAIDLLRAAGATLTTCDAPIGHKVSAACLRLTDRVGGFCGGWGGEWECA